jgi:hypothetical protein
MEDVLDVYHRPYNPQRPLVCVDELGKELQSTPRGRLPLQPGRPVREDYEYRRAGSCNIFLAFQPLRGWRKAQPTAHRTGQDFAEFVRELVDVDFPDAVVIVLVVDNLNTHGPASLYAHFPPEEAHRINAKLEWHYTPEHGSWLNMAECEFSVLAQQCLKRRFADQDTLEKAVTAWADERNAACVKAHWKFTTADARIKLKWLYPVCE